MSADGHRLFGTIAIAAIAGLLLIRPASAALTAKTLATVDVAPPPGARVPMSASLPDLSGALRTIGAAISGKPTVLVFADYTCRSLCGPILAIAATGLGKTGLTAVKDFRLLVLGLDPKDGANAAREMRRQQVGPGAIADASTFLLAREPTIHQIADAVGYHYAYDRDLDQYAHPAVVFVLAGDGRVTRTLSALGLDPADLRLALVEAGRGKVGTFADHLRLLCYGFDPAKGVYTLAVRKWLAIAGMLTIVLLAGGIGFMLLWRSPASRAYPPESAPSEPA
jgi:protein SCO1/2